jgi:hypothetical protein
MRAAAQASAARTERRVHTLLALRFVRRRQEQRHDDGRAAEAIEHGLRRAVGSDADGQGRRLATRTSRSAPRNGTSTDISTASAEAATLISGKGCAACCISTKG